MAVTEVSVRRAALSRMIAASGAVLATFLIGAASVVAAYYPLRHAGFGFEWLLVFLLMTGESAGIHLPSEVILPVGGWLVVRDHHLGVIGALALAGVAAAANTAGSGLLYLGGSKGGRPLVRHYGRYFLIEERDVDSAAERMALGGALEPLGGATEAVRDRGRRNSRRVAGGAGGRDGGPDAAGRETRPSLDLPDSSLSAVFGGLTARNDNVAWRTWRNVLLSVTLSRVRGDVVFEERP